MNLDDLSESNVDYELQIRAVEPRGDFSKKKQLLRVLLRGEDSSASYESHLNTNDDIEVCFSEFNALKMEFPQKGSRIDKFKAAKLGSRLIHLRDRMNRIKIDDEVQRLRVKNIRQVTTQMLTEIGKITLSGKSQSDQTDRENSSPDPSDEEPNDTVRPNDAMNELINDDLLVRTSSPTDMAKSLAYDTVPRPTGTKPKEKQLVNEQVNLEDFESGLEKRMIDRQAAHSNFRSYGRPPGSNPYALYGSNQLSLYNPRTSTDMSNQISTGPTISIKPCFLW